MQWNYGFSIGCKGVQALDKSIKNAVALGKGPRGCAYKKEFGFWVCWLGLNIQTWERFALYWIKQWIFPLLFWYFKI